MKGKMKGKQYGFCVRLHKDEKNGGVDLSIQFIPWDGEEYRIFNISNAVELTWYSLDSTKYWGGFTINLPKLSGLDDLNEINNLLKRVVGDGGGYSFPPQRIVQTLREKGFPQIFYDERVNKFLPVEDILPAEYGTWTNSNHNRVNFMLRVPARNEEEARQLIEEKFQKNDFFERSKADYAYADWKENKDVNVYYNWRHVKEERPDTTPAEERIALEGQRCVECNTPLNADELSYSYQLNNYCFEHCPDRDYVEHLQEVIRWNR